MADAEDSKSSVRKHMRVQVPPSAPDSCLAPLSNAYTNGRQA
jgi:hypothetical protein